MNYPEYLARGGKIGSGEIESACKGSGMHWCLPGTTSLCQLRPLQKRIPPLAKLLESNRARMNTDFSEVDTAG